jgi:aminopeptidase N
MSSEHDSNLTQAEAIQRSKIITTGLTYQVFLDLHKGEVFNGLVSIEFDAKSAEDTFLEFSGRAITAYWINGKKQEKYTWEKGYLQIPGSSLQLGKNKIKIQFENKYFTDGNGIHSFIDGEGKQYIHTQCEPHACNRIFPVFDQPNLKGTYEIYTRAPTTWTVVSCEPFHTLCDWSKFLHEGVNAKQGCSKFYAEIKELFSDVKDTEEYTTKFLHFGKTHPLSSYLTTIVCGDFAKIESHASLLYRDIPQSIYCKQNLLSFAEAQAPHIFELNAKTIKKYEGIFGYMYPFTKCDTIFCPEYTMGAMENPGAITYNEGYLYTCVPTRGQETDRATTICHELAHMWFGDLVTMDWWDDLWLNESFADFVCYLVMHLLIKDKDLSYDLDDAWLAMHFGKSFGYSADESESSTHPIYGEVKDIFTTQSIFDGITYSKGASVLKQLYALVGHDQFSAAMKVYFNKFAWSNTKLQDLLDCLEAALPSQSTHGCYDLKQFKKDWIEEAGHNILQAEWDPKNTSAEAPLVIKQTAQLGKYPLLRYHKIKIGLYGDQGKLIQVLDVIVNNQPETKVTYDGTKGIKGVVLNYDDLDFVKIKLDWNTIDWLKENYANVESGLTKALCCRAIYDQVKTATDIRSFEFLMLFTKIVESEKNPAILEMINSFASNTLHSYSSKNNQRHFQPIVFQAVLKALRETKEPMLRKELTDMVISYAEQQPDLEVLKAWYEGKDATLKDAELTINQKWRCVLKINALADLSDAEKDKLYEELAAKDTTDRKADYKEILRGFRMKPEERAKVIQSLNDDSHGLSFEMLENFLIGFTHNLVPEEVKKTYYEDFFTHMPKWIKEKSHEVSKTILGGMVPDMDDLEGTEQEVGADRVSD